MKPLVDMMAVVVGRKMAVIGKEECYRGTRRYISLALVSKAEGRMWRRE
jgi:hypothetical protein